MTAAQSLNQLTIINGFLDAATVRQINAEWPIEWHRQERDTARKWSSTKLGPTARRVVEDFNARELPRLECITGIKGLMPDPDLFGAGLHCIPPGGFLHMHVDFNRHPNGWHRRVNVLIYLNEDWPGEYGGQLLYGLGEETISVAPRAGRCVIFNTTEDSWHGHPYPLKCPADRERRSLALYFYTEGAPPHPPHSTIYRAQP
jgi:Rps23 Pro-64 3,4-dihydroxylase Tpa1-like proline 4-hydroxylase